MNAGEFSHDPTPTSGPDWRTKMRFDMVARRTDPEVAEEGYDGITFPEAPEIDPAVSLAESAAIYDDLVYVPKYDDPLNPPTLSDLMYIPRLPTDIRTTLVAMDRDTVVRFIDTVRTARAITAAEGTVQSDWDMHLGFFRAANTETRGAHAYEIYQASRALLVEKGGSYFF